MFNNGMVSHARNPGRSVERWLPRNRASGDGSCRIGGNQRIIEKRRNAPNGAALEGAGPRCAALLAELPEYMPVRMMDEARPAGIRLSHAGGNSADDYSIERVRQGERASTAVASRGFNRTAIRKWISAAPRPGVGTHDPQALEQRQSEACPRRSVTGLVLP